MRKLIVALLIVSLGLSVVIASKDSKVFEFNEKRIEPKKYVGFIDSTLDEKELDDGLMLYSGKCTWKEGTGADGEPVQVPVKAYLKLKKKKRLSPIAVYYTQEDGKYYFVLPKKDDYSMGPVTSKALNMPPKVRKFFEEWYKKQDKKFEEPKWNEI